MKATFNDPTQTRPMRGRPFEKGNKFGRGRVAGSKNNATILLEQLLGDESEAVVRKGIELALAGDTAAMKIVLERLIPPARNSRIHLDLPDIVTAASVAEAMRATLRAVGNAEIGPSEAQSIAGLLEIQRKALETAELERRIAVLERGPRG